MPSVNFKFVNTVSKLNNNELFNNGDIVFSKDNSTIYVKMDDKLYSFNGSSTSPIELNDPNYKELPYTVILTEPHSSSVLPPVINIPSNANKVEYYLCGGGSSGAINYRYSNSNTMYYRIGLGGNAGKIKSGIINIDRSELEDPSTILSIECTVGEGSKLRTLRRSSLAIDNNGYTGTVQYYSDGYNTVIKVRSSTSLISPRNQKVFTIINNNEVLYPGFSTNSLIANGGTNAIDIAVIPNTNPSIAGGYITDNKIYDKDDALAEKSLFFEQVGSQFPTLPITTGNGGNGEYYYDQDLSKDKYYAGNNITYDEQGRLNGHNGAIILRFTE